MHLHLWSETDPKDDPDAEATLQPKEIYDDHIQWIGKITVDGKEYHVELRQPISMGQ